MPRTRQPQRRPLWWMIRTALVVLGIVFVVAWLLPRRVYDIVSVDGRHRWEHASAPPRQRIVWQPAEPLPANISDTEIPASAKASLVRPQLADGGATLYFMVKYRKRPGHQAEVTITHHTKLEIAWSLIPLALLMVVFGISTYWYLIMVTPPTEDIYTVEVVAKRWNWTFIYKDEPFEAGTMYIVGNELHLMKDYNYQLIMTTPQNDVIHSLFIPAFRVKQDCVPGRFNKLWFRPTMTHTEAGLPGGFDLYCTEYCGLDHSNMIGKVFVYETREEWVEAVKVAGDITRIEDLVLRGQVIYERDCKACHTIDGSDLIGPSFKGKWGTKSEMTTGEVVDFDKAYVRESVVKPQAKIVKGFENQVMTAFSWGEQTDAYMDGIYAYLESLKD